MTDLEDKVRQEVGKVQDPETGQSFEEMQMIQSVKETEPGTVTVEFVPTSPFCPIAFKLASDIRDAAKTVPGIKKSCCLLPRSRDGRTNKRNDQQAINLLF